MNLEEFRREVDKAAQGQRPATPVKVMLATKDGYLRVPVDDVRFDGAHVVIVIPERHWLW